jgi:predicted metal-dependent peptidase
LIFEEPFYGHILQTLNRRITNSTPTAAVSLNNEQIELNINEYFFMNILNENERVAILKHEVLHLVFKHLYRNEKYRENKYLYNISADLVVNQYIGKWKLPKNAITLKSFPDVKLKEFQSLDYYYEELKKIDESKLDLFVDSDCFHAHYFWDEIDSNSNFKYEIASYNLDKIIVESFDKSSKNKSFGDLPRDIIQAINKIKATFRTNVNWRRSLRLFAQNSARSSIKLTNKRVSKRFYTRPGIKIKRSEKILVALDTSGSISQQEMEVFFSEIDKIYSLGAEVDILECDAKVQAFYEYKGKIPDTVCGRGGTDFDPVIQFLNESKVNYDGCIYLTDGYGPEPKIRPRRKMLWVVNTNIETSHLTTGKIIKLEINE